jgi:hypothetical protein
VRDGTVLRGGYGLSFFPSSMASNAVLRNTPFTFTYAATSAAGSGAAPTCSSPRRCRRRSRARQRWPGPLPPSSLLRSISSERGSVSDQATPLGHEPWFSSQATGSVT